MKMNKSLLLVPALALTLQSALAGDITGKITLNGDAPADVVNDKIGSDPNCGPLRKGETVKVQFYMVDASKGLKDVIVSLKGVSAPSTGAASAPVVLDQRGCEYVPTILALQTGQKLTVKNSDPVLHNVHTNPKIDGNPAKNVAQGPGGGDLTFSYSKAEPFLKFNCDVHPWMFAWITVLDNPYFAVSAKDGTFKIGNVPPGKYTIEAVHRKASGGKPVSKEIEVKADGAKVDFTLDGPK